MGRPGLGRVKVAGRGASGAAARSSRIAHLDRDRPLVEAAQRDPLLFDALYRRYLAQVYSFAFYELGDHHEAEDATERTFLAALANHGRFEERARPADGDGASTFRVWLFQIARNALSNQRRRDRRHPTSPIELAFEYPADDDVQATVGARAELEQVWRAIERMPADRRRALVLRFVNEMSTREIGEILGKSEGATRVLIHRSLQSVAAQLGRTRTSGVRSARGRASN
jgi:RNA polymerase sigma-70 factor (ECF subfamily)